MKFKISLLVLILIVVSAGFWLTNIMKQTASQEFRPTSNNRPDYYMTNFTIHGTDETGLAKFRLKAIQMHHYPIDDHSDLVKPKMLFYTPDGPPWEVSSETGRITSKSQRIILFGKVDIVRPKSETTPKVTISTHELHFEPSTNYLSTDHDVKYTSGLSRIDGKGLRANLKRGFVRILENAKANYAPPKK